jgi:hypothetical protein
MQTLSEIQNASKDLCLVLLTQWADCALGKPWIQTSLVEHMTTSQS